MTHPLRSLFLDMDSYFASIEQHMEPRLRGKPVGVAPMLTESTCCIAASYEAKKFGVKTGTPVFEARKLCPGIEIVAARPPLYVEWHDRIVEIVNSAIFVDHVLSIDEMVCSLPNNWRDESFVRELARTIKTRLASGISDCVRCSIGIAPNGWLAKIASKMEKPNGLTIIHAADLPQALHPLKLRDLHGIGHNMEARLHRSGIHSVEALCAAPREVLRSAWGSLEGERIWHHLRGEPFDNYQTEAPKKRSISHGHVLAPEFRTPERAIAIVHRLVQKAALRMRHHGLRAGGIDLSLRFVSGQKWNGSLNFGETMDTIFLSKRVQELWLQRPSAQTPVKKVNIVLHRLISDEQFTPSLFEQNNPRLDSLNKAMDSITDQFGKKALYLGGAHSAMNSVEAKIAFNHIPDTKLEA